MKPLKLLAAVVLLAMSTSFLTSCSQKDIESLSEEGALQKYDTYLSLATGKIPENPTDEEWKIIDEAHCRLDYETDSNGIITIKQESAADVNISNELFNYFKGAIERHNMLIQGTGPNTNLTRIPYDCVAIHIVLISQRLGSPLDYGLVNSWIYNHYGITGVPVDKMKETVQRFLVATQVTLPFSTASLGNGQILLVINNQHAVLFDNIYGDGDIRYYDHQKSYDPDIPYEERFSECGPESITDAYLATGVVGS
ncbi:MAG: hypothetical protein IJB87_02095 [Alistipes sp.]|nr:hypothetical protein [Alistipes sp.]